MSDAQPIFTLAQTQKLFPDEQHYESTVQNFVDQTDFTEEDPVWSFESVPVSQIDQSQLVPPSHRDEFSTHKIHSLRAAMRAQEVLPPVYLLHSSHNASPYYLLEGLHRHNAAHDERIGTIAAWLGHVDCDCLASWEGR
ncbi:ParB N-terminal domain-containing protein [Intrasporangium sp. YIM S08009]|uniref:ParB N-terminal domain-containing protein n=1 Tax=Intrasporangium zincisolvens TaxID=3080018 RepID=UPI002B05E53C|nr:ParB N-terminal domain-containing protein [Intrasporangium sp. YIM S08009]